jgi:hypothetical protein
MVGMERGIFGGVNAGGSGELGAAGVLSCVLGVLHLTVRLVWTRLPQKYIDKSLKINLKLISSEKFNQKFANYFACW